MSEQEDRICFLSKESDFAIFTFSLYPQEVRPPNRAKFNPFRRAEVAAVRKRGSCLRCKLLKIKCSDTDPCETCYKLAKTLEQHLENKTLRFAECIRTQMKDINIFESKLGNTAIQDVNMKIGGLSDLMNSINLTFAVEWDIDKLLTGAIAWLKNQESHSVSQAGILCSPDFAKLIKEVVPQEISRNFQLLLWSTSLAHCISGKEATRVTLCRDLEEIATLTGHNFLLDLDRYLGSGYILKGAGNSQPLPDAIKTSFLLTLGTVIGIQYTTGPKQSRLFPTIDSERGSPTTLWSAMRDHLCLMLTHHLIFLGSRLGIPISLDFERHLLAGSARLWDKKGEFAWMFGASERVERIGLDGTCLSTQLDGAKSQPDLAVLPEMPERESMTRGFFGGLWFCCDCGDGPMTRYDISSCSCGHTKCDCCTVEGYSVQKVV